jgi:hypothetical protein
MKRLTLFAFYLIFPILLTPCLVAAEMTVISATGEYIMGDNDTFIEAKKLALQDAKRLVLEKIGTYIESTTIVKDKSVSSDEIKQYTAGIVKIDEISEERKLINNVTSVIKVNVRASVDPEAILSQVKQLQKRSDIEAKSKKLNDENIKLRREIEFLNFQLSISKDEKQNREYRQQRETVLEKMLQNEKGLIVLVSGEALVKTSLLDKQKKETDKQIIDKFLQEIADSYKISMREPEIDDNGDNTSNVTINYSLQLPGRFDLNSSQIYVPSGKAFLSLGFNISAFQNGGLYFKCSDRKGRCEKILFPYFEEKIRKDKMYVQIKVGKHESLEEVGFFESRSSTTPQRTIESESHSNLRTTYPKTYTQPTTVQKTYVAPKSSGSFELFYPVRYRGSFTSKFERIMHSDLRSVNNIEIKVIRISR